MLTPYCTLIVAGTRKRTKWPQALTENTAMECPHTYETDQKQ